MSIRYRVWQTWQWLVAGPLPDEAWSAISTQLSPAELNLFRQYRPHDRRHAYRVMTTLQESGHLHPALLTAALLHDIGKTRLPLPIWERVIVVIGGKLLPGRSADWGAGEPDGWRRAFVIKAKHPEWGAEMAAAAQSDPLAVKLIRHHQDPMPPEPAGGAKPRTDTQSDHLLRLLQWADNRS